MLKLAQSVFERSGIESYRAFSQFRNVNDLATLVTAKRKNVFDYGRCIQTDAKGNVRFPSNPTAIMGAVSRAVDGNYEDIDFRVLGLVDDEGVPIVKMRELCPASDPKPEKKAKKVKVEAPVERVTAPPALQVVADPVEDIPESSPREPTNEVPSHQQDVADETISAVFLTGEAVIDKLDSRITSHLDKLRGDLADAFQSSVKATKAISGKSAERLEDEIGYVKKDIEDIKASQVGLAAFLNTINLNIQMVLQCFDPYGEVEPCPPGVLKLIEGSVPDDIDERLEEDEVLADSVDVVSPPQQEREEPAPVVEEPADADGTVEYSRDELAVMELDDLRKLAEDLGVPKARSIPYRASLIERICKTYVG
jgi:hypothetical protein